MIPATRVGDRVRLCWDGYEDDSALWSDRVKGVSSDGFRVKVANNIWVDSWVRVPAKKGRK